MSTIQSYKKAWKFEKSIDLILGVSSSSWHKAQFRDPSRNHIGRKPTNYVAVDYHRIPQRYVLPTYKSHTNNKQKLKQ